MVAIAAISGSVFADGSIDLTTWDSGNSIYYLMAGKPAGGSGFYAEVLAGPNQTVIRSTADNSAKFLIEPDGNFDGGFGYIPNVAPNSAVSITLRAWKGATSYDKASERASVSWIQEVGDNPAAPAFPRPAMLNIPTNLIIVPVNTAPPMPIVLTNSAMMENGEFKLSISNTPGLTITAFATTDLSLQLTNWTRLPNMVEVSSGQYELIDTEAAKNARRFYRLSLP